MISREAVLLLAFALISFLGAVSYFILDDDIAFTNMWMLCNALTYPILLLVIRLQSKNETVNLIASTLIILSVGEVLDELFFNPVEWGWPEIVNLIIATIYVIYKCTTKRK